jgi:CheY-like chemotaxis protein
MKIMLVDDDPDVLKLLEDILVLKFPSIEVMVSKNGADCLTKLRLMPPEELPDLIICDQKMPVMGGAQLSAIVKQDFPSMKITLMTAFGDTMGDFDQVFFKPLDFDLVFNYITSLWNQIDVSA